jgi:tRNA threonylcarbamoyladenosine biosynthesis protein TsaB
MNGIILAIESSGDGGGAAVLRDGVILAEVAVPAPRTHGAQLMVCVDRACTQAKVARAQIDVVAVNCGPGSYTGLRIGLALAAGLGHGLNRPVVGVPCFEAMALQFVLQTGPGPKAETELWPVLDARREEVMTARFTWQGDRMTREGQDLLVAPEQLGEQAAQGAIVFGSGLPAYPGRWDQARLKVNAGEFMLGAGSLGLAAQLQLAGVKDPVLIPRAPVMPRYFRQVTAKTIAERTGEPDSRDVTDRVRSP